MKTVRYSAALLAFVVSICTSFQCLAQQKAADAPWFQNCDKLAKKSRNLAEFLERGDKTTRFGPCFLLNRNELLYVDNEQGTNFTGLFYVKLGVGQQESVRLTVGGTSIRKEFRSTNGKRYAWIRSSWGNHGMHSTSDYLLYLTPKVTDEVFKLTWLFNHQGEQSCSPSNPGSKDVVCPRDYESISLNEGLNRGIELNFQEPALRLSDVKFKYEGNLVSGFERTVALDSSNAALFTASYVLQIGATEFRMVNFDSIEGLVKTKSPSVRITLLPNKTK